MNAKPVNREAWLHDATWRLAEVLPLEVPSLVRVSCGFPVVGALSKKRRRIGECWSPTVSPDGTHQIFISPLLGDPIEVLAVLSHELVHAVVGTKHGHKAPFKRVAVAIGLTGPMRATVAGPELTERLNALYDRLGPYPHAGMTPDAGRKKQGTRLLKIMCPDCGYVCRTTQTWIDTGLPTCVCGTEMIES